LEELPFIYEIKVSPHIKFQVPKTFTPFKCLDDIDTCFCAPLSQPTSKITFLKCHLEVDETLAIINEPKRPKKGDYKEQNGSTHVLRVVRFKFQPFATD
jgi:hypothetical protein